MAKAGAFWKTVLVFGLIQPFIGGLALGLVGMRSEFGGLGSDNTASENLVAVLSWGLFGYPFGIIPAILTGLFASAISPRIPSAIFWVFSSTIVGAIIGAGSMAVLFGGGEAFAFYGAICGAAAFASALIGLRVRPHRSN